MKADLQDLNDLVKGYRQVVKGIAGGYIRCVVIARDADESIIGKITSLCHEKRIPYRFEPTKKEMGDRLQLDVACAVYGEREVKKEANSQ